MCGYTHNGQHGKQMTVEIEDWKNKGQVLAVVAVPAVLQCDLCETNRMSRFKYALPDT